MDVFSVLLGIGLGVSLSGVLLCIGYLRSQRVHSSSGVGAVFNDGSDKDLGEVYFTPAKVSLENLEERINNLRSDYRGLLCDIDFLSEDIDEFRRQQSEA